MTIAKLFTYYNNTKGPQQLILFVLWKLFVNKCISHPFRVMFVYFADALTYCVARL